MQYDESIARCTYCSGRARPHPVPCSRERCGVCGMARLGLPTPLCDSCVEELQQDAASVREFKAAYAQHVEVGAVKVRLGHVMLECRVPDLQPGRMSIPGDEVEAVQRAVREATEQERREKLQLTKFLVRCFARGMNTVQAYMSGLMRYKKYHNAFNDLVLQWVLLEPGTAPYVRLP